MSSTKIATTSHKRTNDGINDKSSIQKEIYDVVNYFNYFKYSPSLTEIWTFLPTKISQTKLKLTLDELVHRHKLSCKIIRNLKIEIRNLPTNSRIYTLPGHSINKKRRTMRHKNAENKIDTTQKYIRLLNRISAINFVGFSGGVAMMDTDENDDIDLCIISQKNRMWTARFWALMSAQIIGRRRTRLSKNVSNTVCLNLFFDGRDLSIPTPKRNLFVAHEVMQMKPIFSRQNTYERFIKENKWVFEFFPNSHHPSSRGVRSLDQTRDKLRDLKRLPRSHRSLAMTVINYLGDMIELLLKKLQLHIINKHRSTEPITDTQLWFFPNDMEMRLRKDQII